MDSDRERRLLSLVDTCMKLSAGERLPFLRANCADTVMFEEARALVEGDPDEDDFLERPIPALGVTPTQEDELPEQIGPYRVLGLIGKGGMGTVYRVQQEEPTRVVALKMIRWDVSSDQTLARFALEYSALARMNHEAIARIYDVGNHLDYPYFTMEYIEGVPIDRFCREHRLGLRERLELFLVAASGISHAHRNGVIHRDLKPGNVLVRRAHDGHKLKVIDFGIAKGFDDQGGEALGVQTTLAGYLVGTPGYMSPEQVDRRRGPLDIRTDVFGLGTILYELITGRPPIAPGRLVGASLDELYRAICLEEPLPPSRVREGEIGETLGTRHLARELDWIVLKALAKEPDRRYETVAAMAQDVRHFLADRPVQAGPPSIAYKMKKFVRRHQSRLTLALLTGGLALALSFYFTTLDRARQSEKLGHELTSAFSHTLTNVNPYLSLQTTSLADYLALTSARISQIDADPPSLITLQAELADTLAAMGRPAAAVESVEQAIRIAEMNLDRDSPNVFRLRERAAFFRFMNGELDKADDSFRQLLFEAGQSLKPDDLLMLDIRTGLATVCFTRGDFDEAAQRFEAIYQDLSNDVDPDHPKALLIEQSLGSIARQRNEYDLAESIYCRVLDRQLVHTDRSFDHPEVLNTRENILIIENDRGNYGMVEAAYRALVEDRIRVQGRQHADTLDSLNGLALNLFKQGKTDEAESIYREVAARQEELLGDSHLDYFTTVINLTDLLSGRAEHEEVARLLQPLIPRMIRILRPDHRLVLNARLNLAHTYKELSRTQEARTLLEHNMEILAAKRYDSMRLLSLGTLAETHFSAGEHEKAKPLIEEYLDLGPQSTQEARQYLGYFRELREKNENEITKGAEVTTGAI